MSELGPEDASTSQHGQATCRLLLERISEKGDLPGFSAAVSSIRRAMEINDETHEELIQTILSDPALVQMVLRLANSAMYSRFGRNISTISRAVVVLGQHAIGHLAFGIKLVDGLNGIAPSSARDTQALMQRAVVSGHIARRLVGPMCTAQDGEEVIVATMLNSLGAILVSYYLPERWSILSAASDTGPIETQAREQHVLGLSVQRLGRFMAQVWGLPNNLLVAMQTIEARRTDEPLSHGDWLATMATLGTRLATLMLREASVQPAELDQLARDYGEMLNQDIGEFSEELAAAIGAGRAEVAASQHLRAAPKPEHQVARALKKGLGDIERAIGDASTSEILSMAVEVAFVACQPSQAVLFLRQRREHLYRAKFSLGSAINAPAGEPSFGEAYQPDMFHAALSTRRINFVENANAATSASYLPGWYRSAFPQATAFVILPLTCNQQPLALIYIGWNEGQSRPRIAHEELQVLNRMRDVIDEALSLKLTALGI